MGQIREVNVLHGAGADERRQVVLEALAELETQLAAGEVEQAAYLMKKRALIRAF